MQDNRTTGPQYSETDPVQPTPSNPVSYKDDGKPEPAKGPEMQAQPDKFAIFISEWSNAITRVDFNDQASADEHWKGLGVGRIAVMAKKEGGTGKVTMQRYVPLLNEIVSKLPLSIASTYTEKHTQETVQALEKLANNM